MAVWLNIEISAGTAVDKAAEDAQRVADLLGVSVEFNFNDVKCFAAPGGDAALLATTQQSEQGRKLSGPFDQRFASSRTRASVSGDK